MTSWAMLGKPNDGDGYSMMSMTKLDASEGDWRGTEFAQHVKDL